MRRIFYLVVLITFIICVANQSYADNFKPAYQPSAQQIEQIKQRSYLLNTFLLQLPKDYQEWLFSAYYKLYPYYMSLPDRITKVAPLEFLVFYFYLLDNYPALNNPSGKQQIIYWLSDPANGLNYSANGNDAKIIAAKFGKISFDYKTYTHYFYKYVDSDTAIQISHALYNFYYDSVQIRAYKQLYNYQCTLDRHNDYTIANEVMEIIKNSKTPFVASDLVGEIIYNPYRYLAGKVPDELIDKIKKDFLVYKMPYYVQTFYEVIANRDDQPALIMNDLLNTQLDNDYKCYLELNNKS